MPEWFQRFLTTQGCPPNTLGWTQNREWLLHHTIGSGSFGVVVRASRRYVARDSAGSESDRIFYAIKTWRDDPAVLADEDPDRFQKVRLSFERELAVLPQLKHAPNVVKFVEQIDFAPEVAGLPSVHTFATEYIDGHTLDKLVKRHGALPQHEALLQVREILRALVYLQHNFNDFGIVNRDLKPDNVLLDMVDGVSPRLCDFGLAALLAIDQNEVPASTTDGAVVYQAPERLLRSHFGTKSDVYSVGCILYFLCTARHPPRLDHDLDFPRKHREMLDAMRQIVSDDIVAFFEQLVFIDPSGRIDSKSALLLAENLERTSRTKLILNAAASPATANQQALLDYSKAINPALSHRVSAHAQLITAKSLAIQDYRTIRRQLLSALLGLAYGFDQSFANGSGNDARRAHEATQFVDDVTDALRQIAASEELQRLSLVFPDHVVVKSILDLLATGLLSRGSPPRTGDFVGPNDIEVASRWMEELLNPEQKTPADKMTDWWTRVVSLFKQSEVAFRVCSEDLLFAIIYGQAEDHKSVPGLRHGSLPTTVLE